MPFEEMERFSTRGWTAMSAHRENVGVDRFYSETVRALR
jgi:hypothetical protein